MATELGKAYVQIVPSAQGISGKIEKELNGSGAGEAAGEKTGGKFGAKFLAASGKALKAVGKVTLAATGAAAAGVAKLAQTATQSYGEFEQLRGGTQKIFSGLNYDDIAADAYQAFSTLNLSASDYLESINNIGGTFKASMGDAAAYDTAKEGLKAISDYATGTGEDVGNLVDKYKLISRAGTQYQTIADQFSSILPQSSDAFIDQAYAAGFLSKRYESMKDIPIAEYQQALTKMLTKGVAALNLTDNAAEESSKTLTGSIAAAKGAWDNLVTAFADPEADLGARLDDFINAGVAALKNAVPTFARALSGIANALPQVVSSITEILPSLVTQLLPSLVTAAVSLVTALASALPGILPVVMQSALQALMTLIPVLLQLLPQLLAVGMQMVTYLVQVLTQMAPQLIPAAIQMIANLIQGLLMNLPQLVAAAMELVIAIIDAFLNTDWKTVGKTILKGIKDAFLGGGSDDFSDVGASLAANVSSSADTALAGASFTMPAVDMSQFDASLTASAAAIPAPEIDWSTMSSSSTELDLGTMVNVNDTGLTTKFTDAATSSAAALTDYDWSSTGSSLLSKTANGMSASGAMRSSASRQAQNAASAVNGYDWASVGKNIVDGIAQGVTDNGENITTALTDVLNDVAENVTMTLQINSPSRVYADEVGRWIPEGIALGITQHAGTVAEAMDGAVRPLTVTGSAVRSAATETGRQYSGIGGSRSAGVTQTSSAQMVSAFKEALREMKVELDDREVGRFVERTVVRGFSA